MKQIKIAAAIFVAIPLAGCASSHLIVERPASGVLHADTVTLTYEETSTGVSPSSVAYLQHKMDEAFFGGRTTYFHHGDGLTVRYRFVGYDRGSRLGRYALGTFGVGEAQMVLEATFTDASGTVLAVVRGQSAVRAGFFGGSANTAIDKAVNEIRDYAVQHFRG
jgi:hypothetical protein